MPSVEEYEKLRGEAEVKLQIEIYRLRKACEREAPNSRSIVKLVASLDRFPLDPCDEDERQAG